MKYKIYKTFGNTASSVGLDINKHELIGVEYGSNIDEVTDDLMKSVVDDLSATEEYSRCDVYTYPPDKITGGPKALRSKYTYTLSGIVSPIYAKQNIIVYYAIVEENE